MHPIIARLGPLTIYSYGMMVAIAFIIGLYLAKLEAKRKDIKVDLVYDFAFYIIIGSLIGARLYYLAFFEPAGFIKNPIAIFKIWQGGLAIHGAILGGTLIVLVFSKIHKISFWKLADLFTPSVILGQAIGRIGCFLNGCCFGVPTKSFLGVNFPKESLAHITYNGLAVHPTQLYETFFSAIGFLFLWSIRRRIKFDGGLFLLYLLTYNCVRIVLSSLRGDSLYIWGTGLKSAQIISGIIICAAIIIFTKKRKNV
ncbi:prolipoprotein diacylglyceryl transferase [Candidatus Omnitrophota bacterium]